jgi:PAS domain S-box-containing protein
VSDPLRKNDRFMKTLTDFMPGMVGYWTQELRCEFANREYLDWFGKKAEEMNGIRMQDLLGEVLFAKNEPYILSALAGEIQKFERTLTKVNGESRETLAHYIPHIEDSQVLGFFVLILDITDRKHLEAAVVAVAEECQRSLGQELHDNLGQQLAAIAYQASALEKTIQSSGSADDAKFAASIAVQAQSAVMQCKQLAQGLLPFEIEASGLMLALQALAARVGINYQVGCEFVCTSPDVWLVDATIALNLYRIAQEAVSNAVRHGKAKKLTILFASDSAGLRLSIFDDGCGFEEKAECATGGMGIKIMQCRVKELGGTLAFLVRAEGGTEVRMEMRRG